MIERIRREHGYMVRLLAILKKKHHHLKNERTISYPLLKEVVDYLCSHSEKTHHPKEDILYHYYLEHYGHQKAMMNLEAEHLQLAKMTRDFLETVDMILKDAVVPLEIFTEQLDGFIHAQKRHLELEEKEILPLIANTFTVHDWQQVEAHWSLQEDDPVFGETIADKYQLLAQRIKETETE